jgi:hypothetical protein
VSVGHGHVGPVPGRAGAVDHVDAAKRAGDHAAQGYRVARRFSARTVRA